MKAREFGVPTELCNENVVLCKRCEEPIAFAREIKALLDELFVDVNKDNEDYIRGVIDNYLSIEYGRFYDNNDIDRIVRELYEQ